MASQDYPFVRGIVFGIARQKLSKPGQVAGKRNKSQNTEQHILLALPRHILYEEEE